MRNILLALLVLMIAYPAGSRGIASDLGNRSSRGLRLIIDDALVVSATGYHLGESYPMAHIGFELGSDFVGNIYGCDFTTYAADTCDLLVTISAADVDLNGVTTWRQNYVLTVSTDEGASTTSRLEIKGTDSQVASAVDPSYTVRFETAVAATDDPMVYSYTAVRPLGLHCCALGLPSNHIVTVNECNSSAASCGTVGLSLEFDAAGCSSDITVTDTAIAQGVYWGVHTTSLSTAADSLDCTVHAERG